MKAINLLPGVCFCCIFSSFNNFSISQNGISILPGGGLGHALQNKLKKNRVELQLSSYLAINKRFSAGIELATSEPFLYPIKDEVSVNASTNTLTLDASNMGASTALTKIKYFIGNNEKVWNPFIEMGVGLNTYSRTIYNLEDIDSKKVRRSNLAVQPEIGFSTRHFQASIAYLITGSTPGFRGLNEDGNIVVLYSIQLNTLNFNISWRIEIGRK